jgi:glycosyltransferase involved in cell wall biosynthesis
MDDRSTVNRYAAAPMPRLLLIKSANDDFDTRATTAAIANRFSPTLYTFPRPDLAATARSLPQLKRLSRSHGVVHAVGGQALAAALLATSPGQRLLYSPVGHPTRRAIGWLRAVNSYRDLEIICTSDTMRRDLVTRGVPVDRCNLIRPGVNLRSIPTARDDALRARLGLSPDQTALLAPLEMTYAGGHRLTTWALSLLAVIQPQYRLLLPGRGPLRKSVIHFGRSLLNPNAVIDAAEVVPDVPIESLFSAADAVLLTPEAPVPPLIVAMSMASDRPIVATTTPQLCELIEDRHTALLVTKPSPRLIAQRVMDLFADAKLSWQIQDRARAEAYDSLTQSKMLSAYETLYTAPVPAGGPAISGSSQVTDSPAFAKPSEA